MPALRRLTLLASLTLLTVLGPSVAGQRGATGPRKPAPAATALAPAPEWATAPASTPDRSTATDGPVSVRLLAERPSWAPQSSEMLGVAFTPAPGWHLYWPGVNDSGLPVRIAARSPDGLRFGELQWPAPSRLVHPGPLLDHVYAEPFMLLLPVTLPSEAPAGGHWQVEAEIDWLVCEEACLRGGVTLSLEVPLASADGRSDGAPQAATQATPADADGDEDEVEDDATQTRGQADAALFSATRAQLPGALPADVRTRWITDADGTRLELIVPGAQHLEFYPLADGLPLADLVARCAADGERLELLLDAGAAAATGSVTPQAPTASERLRGVLAITRAGRHDIQPVCVDLPGPAASQGSAPTGAVSRPSLPERSR